MAGLGWVLQEARPGPAHLWGSQGCGPFTCPFTCPRKQAWGRVGGAACLSSGVARVSSPLRLPESPAQPPSPPIPALPYPHQALPCSSAWSSTTPAAGARGSKPARQTETARWWRASTSLTGSRPPAPRSGTGGSRPYGKAWPAARDGPPGTSQKPLLLLGLVSLSAKKDNSRIYLLFLAANHSHLYPVSDPSMLAPCQALGPRGVRHQLPAAGGRSR